MTVVAFSDITAMRTAEHRLTHLAHHDGLTGLPNRLLFNDRLDQALERARREQAHCALLFIDLDGFKLINDTLGHSMGDQLLGCLAARLKESVRASDTAARLSGDEFVVIAEHIAHPENAALLADKLLNPLAMPVT
ncbi:MAG: GGDEF domain-containing protein, partial [Gammaproteobacteria bacterium]|nr:GGDEF domain-containing protein [Gammaproteobacteria bacterium]